MSNSSKNSFPWWENYPLEEPAYILILSNITAALILLLNIPHLVILLKMPKEKYYAALNNRFLLINVTVLDLISGVVRMPLSNYPMQKLLFEFPPVCAVSAVLGFTPSSAVESLLLLGVIDRFIAISRPLAYSKNFFVKHYRLFFIPVYAFFMGIYAGVLSSNGPKSYLVRGFSYCGVHMSMIRWLGPFMMCVVFGPMLVSFVIYGIILYRIHQQNNQTPKEKKYTKTATMTTLAITICQLICWFPVPLHVALMAQGYKETEISIMKYLPPMIISLNSVVHPIVYGILDPRYRRFIKKSLCGGFNKLNSSEDRNFELKTEQLTMS